MVQSSHSRTAALALTSAAAIALVATACSRGSNVSNAAPRISSVPAQSTLGGTAFSLDLGDYVTDREGATLTFAVTSGGGSFTDDTYTNTFDAMGTYTVSFTVNDGAKVATGSFDVQVTTSNFVVVQEDTAGLFLLDSGTNGQVRVASAVGSPTFAAGLADGRMAYQVGGTQLWLFDPMNRTSRRLAGDAAGAATFRAKTSDSRLFYTTGSAPDMTLSYYNPLTGLARQVDDGGLATFTLLVNSSDLAFYETGVDGQADVYYYDPVEDESFAVGVAETDEQVLAVLPDGGCVFSRIGGGGETDLFYFRVGTGVVEIGLDVPAIATLSKSFDGNGSGSQVVFTASNGAVRELYVWNPSNGQTAAIATSSDNVVDGIGDGNEVVYHTIVSASEHDVFCYDIDTQATVTVRNASDIGQVLAVTTGTPAFAVVLGDGDTSTIHAVSLVGSPATTSLAAGGAVSTTVGQLPNGDVVAQRTDGTALGLFDVSGVAWSAPFTGSGLAFAGPGLDDGDFVATIGTGASANLSMWDASATAIVVLSSTAGEDTYQTLTDDATILFTRVVDTNTTADLFSWDGTSETRLTNQDSAGLDHDHTVLAKYAGSR